MPKKKTRSYNSSLSTGIIPTQENNGKKLGFDQVGGTKEHKYIIFDGKGYFKYFSFDIKNPSSMWA